ncbi:MAG: long-chain fatty acid--CoA ligase [Caulobacteraceae bacterium]|jgi:long-chain acyl-CoA synthetase|nr:long-chain fatty acid--CoA ligase [Caulobacteraceae bacterium]
MSAPHPGSLEYWADQQPDAPALIEGERVVTWRAWNEEADRLAHGLRRLGLQAGDILVTRLQIRPEWPIVSAAAGKLGCRILGLNWRLTPSETRYVLANSGAQAIICDDADPAALAPAFEGLDLKFAVSIDTAANGFEPYADLVRAPPAPLYAAGNPPLILYTSGTTGLPKGVVMGARPDRHDPEVARQIREYQQSVAGSRPQVSGDVQLITLPMHHGAGPGAVWGSLARGNTMVLLRRFDPEDALRLIEKHRVTAWTGVPTMYKRLAGLPPEILARYDVSSIRILGVGAAPVPYSLKQWIIGHFGPRLSEGYGATEVGMITALLPEMQTLKPGSSGLPHTHVTISIRDEDGAELGRNEEGEIWVRTPMVIRGYLNAKPLERDTLDEAGFFRTGDVGRLDEDGYLFITDRAKDMIVSGGVNIYPAEIEAAIIRHPAVQDVAVIGIPDDDFGEQVKAFCELKPGRAAAPEEILAHCADTLAGYKRPKTLEIVAELPRNTMGKLLKRELRDPYWKGRERNV